MITSGYTTDMMQTRTKYKGKLGGKTVKLLFVRDLGEQILEAYQECPDVENRKYWRRFPLGDHDVKLIADAIRENVLKPCK